MCNEDLLDSLKEIISGLITHTDEVRLKFGEVQESHREGNLDNQELADLSQAIHMLEADSASFEKILGG
jgi:ribosomal protein L16 Arg81 hydroxylase